MVQLLLPCNMYYLGIQRAGCTFEGSKVHAYTVVTQRRQGGTSPDSRRRKGRIQEADASIGNWPQKSIFFCHELTRASAAGQLGSAD